MSEQRAQSINSRRKAHSVAWGSNRHIPTLESIKRYCANRKVYQHIYQRIERERERKLCSAAAPYRTHQSCTSLPVVVRCPNGAAAGWGWRSRSSSLLAEGLACSLSLAMLFVLCVIFHEAFFLSPLMYINVALISPGIEFVEYNLSLSLSLSLLFESIINLVKQLVIYLAWTFSRREIIIYYLNFRIILSLPE